MLYFLIVHLKIFKQTKNSFASDSSVNSVQSNKQYETYVRLEIDSNPNVSQSEVMIEVSGTDNSINVE